MFFRSRVLLCLVLLAACQQPVTYTPTVTPEELATEEAYQQRLIDEAAARGGVPKKWSYNRSKTRQQFLRVGERIEQAGAELCQEMGLPRLGRSCYYYFMLSGNKEINAYADGESVVIQMGLMRFVENDDELAGVMAHELAHNLMDHIRKGGLNNVFGGIIGTALDTVAAGQGVNTGGNFGAFGQMVATASFSPAFEAEADYVGLYIMQRAGYDIRKMPDYWRRLAVAIPEGASGGISHPSNAARFVALQKAIYEIEYKKKHRVPLLPDFRAEF